MATQNIKAIPKKEFLSSFQDVVLYLMTKDPLLTRYLIAKLPPSLSIDPQVRLYLNNYLEQRAHSTIVSKQNFPNRMTLEEFVASVSFLATYYTNTEYNPFRAKKYIRILKLLGDDRHRELQSQLRRRKTNVA